MGFSAVIMIGAGAAMVFGALWMLLSAYASRRWPKVSGRIVLSRLRRVSDGEGGYAYCPEVSYCYSVGGRELTASRIRFGDPLSGDLGPRAASKVMKRYPFGAEVTVHYEPSDPRVAVLDTRPNPWLYALLIAGCVFAGIGTVV